MSTSGHVWFEQRRVGALRTQDGRIQLTYDPQWLQSGFPVSLSLPLRPEEHDAHCYFAGLLPEGRARQRIATQLKLAPDDEAGMLFELGRDCAGALSILPDDEVPIATSSTPHRVTEEELRMLVQSRGVSVPRADRQRFSLAGAQDKVAVVSMGDQWFMPTEALPSSHILKFETLPWVCFAEYTAHALAVSIGLEVAETHFARLSDSLPYLVVTRYDRSTEQPRRRIHQEDLTQALGLPGSRKYQVHAGPSLADVAELIRHHARRPVRDLLALRDWQLFNYLVGNADAHAKNISLLYDQPGGPPRLAPFYDLVCIEMMNRIGATHFDRSMAFHVGERSLPEEIRRQDWQRLAQDMHLSPKALLDKLEELANELPQAATEVRTTFAEQHGDNQVYDRFVEVITDRCRWTLNTITR